MRATNSKLESRRSSSLKEEEKEERNECVKIAQGGKRFAAGVASVKTRGRSD